MVDVPSFFRLDGQVAVVTGGASGIGEATAHVLASVGASVVVADIDGEGAAATVKQIEADGGTAISVVANTSKRADVDAMVDRAVSEYGQLDILCNIAGVGYNKAVMDTSEDDFDRLIAINLKGVFLGCQAAIRVMQPRGSGAIVNVSSTAIDCPYPGQALYGMTKSGVAFLSQVLGAEAGPMGIRVNAIAPGSTPTNFGNFRHGGKPDPEAEEGFQKMMTSITPSGFLGEAIDQAMIILYLVTPASRWANGNIWRVNGGQSRAW